MKLKLEDGREVATLAVAMFEEFIHALACVELLDKTSLNWLMSRLSEAESRVPAKDGLAVITSYKSFVSSELF